MITISIDPIIFQIGHFAFRWYGLTVLIAIQVGICLIAREAERKRFKVEPIYKDAISVQQLKQADRATMVGMNIGLS